MQSLAKIRISSAGKYSYLSLPDGIILTDEYQVNSSVVTK
jgi:hypothetical protein